MLEVKIKPVRENFKMPVKGSDHAACFDCYASEIEVQPDGSVHVKLGFETEIPEGWRADLLPRSNITKYPWVLANSEGIIDSDFRNEWQARFRPVPYNQSIEFFDDVYVDSGKIEVTGNGSAIKVPLLFINKFPYKVGDRVCQIRFERVNPVNFILSDETSETERGLGGFGSSGVK